MSSLYKGLVCPLRKLIRVESIESSEHLDHVGAFAQVSCILKS